MKSGFKYFVIASSLPATLWPLLGLAVSNTRGGGDLDFTYVGLVTGNIRFIVLIGGPIFYGMVWRFVVYPLEQAFIEP